MVSTWPNGFRFTQGSWLYGLQVLVANETRMEAKYKCQTSHYKKWRFQTGNEIKFQTVKFIFALWWDKHKVFDGKA